MALKSSRLATPLSQKPITLTRSTQTSVASRPAEWGWLPMLSLIGAFGLLLIAIANVRWRNDNLFSTEIFWFGLLLMYVPVVVRQIVPDISREERIGLIILLTIGLYAVKMFNSPLLFKGFDELLHWRTANDMIQSEHLFQHNPVLPVSPFYPGLESIVSALNKIGGLDVFVAGVILIGAARLVFVIALYMFYRRISGSEQLASVATLLYMANPSFVFFNTMFSYESLALPFAGLFLFALSRWLYTRHNSPAGLTLVVILAISAVVITHHLTTYAMLLFLTLWAVIDAWIQRFYNDEKLHLGWTPTLFAYIASLAWVLYVATITVGYLAPEIASAVQELLNFLLGQSTGRTLFSTKVGTKAPIGEQLSGFAAMGFIVLVLPFGLLQVWKKYRTKAPIVTMGIGALGYPASQAFRLVNVKADIAGRSAEFLFVALAFVLALGLIEFLLPYATRRNLQAVVVGCIGIIFMGGVAVGWKPLPPGPHLVAASTRSVDSRSISTAKWVDQELEPNRRIISDRINGLLMVVFGRQYQVTLSEDWIHVPDVFFAPRIGPEELSILRAGEVEYLVVDRRLSNSLPFLGFYFEQSETNAFNHQTPIEASALAKFDDIAKVSRIFDNGEILIYYVRPLWDDES